jgi:uncharacterized SAM-binding protein YcdF (DUF218 family)
VQPVHESPGVARAIVVLGNGQADVDGTYCLTPSCHGCLELAARLADALQPRVVVFSGWSPVGGESEGAQMRTAWPGRRDVELVAEHTATITAENMSRSLPLLLERGIGEATIVASAHHMLRVRFFFSVYGRFGIRTRYAAARSPRSLHALAWEAAALPLMRGQRRRALAELAVDGLL